MSEKLNCILLVDDDTTTNFFNEYMLKKMDVSTHIEVALNGQEALDYMDACEKDPSKPKPDMILLDVNMPVMNGFEFLEAYQDRSDADGIVICMLTTSLHESDVDKAKEFNALSDYIHKPLSEDSLKVLIEKYFPKVG